MFRKFLQGLTVLTVVSFTHSVMAAGEYAFSSDPASPLDDSEKYGTQPNEGYSALPERMPSAAKRIEGKEATLEPPESQLKRASTQILKEYVHAYSLKNGSDTFMHLSLTSHIWSLYIEGTYDKSAEDTPALSEANQGYLAAKLEDFGVKNLIFFNCKEFSFIPGLQNVISKKGITVEWQP